jgi:hypothetical protein
LCADARGFEHASNCGQQRTRVGLAQRKPGAGPDNQATIVRLIGAHTSDHHR